MQGDLVLVNEVLRSIRSAMTKYDNTPGRTKVTIPFESVTNHIREEMDRWESDLQNFIDVECEAETYKEGASQ